VKLSGILESLRRRLRGHRERSRCLPRRTALSVDFDVFVRPSTANLFRIKAALEASGLGDLSAVDPEIWAKSRALFRIGEPPLQIDILLAISGVEYHTASADAVDGMYGDVPVRFLGRTALITNKKASGRPKDLADVDLLTSDDPER
jgi:hypothetical protein